MPKFLRVKMHASSLPVWNEQQLQFIHQPFNSHGKLIGIPGAGKTTTILERCEHWKRALELESKHYLILMYSNQACNDFKQKAKVLGVKGYTNSNVKTIHSLAGSILHQVGLQCALQTCVINACDALTNEVVHNVAALEKVRNIVVDEAQDLSNEQYQLVMKAAQLTGAVVTMVGDPDQAIFGFQGGDQQYLLNHPGYTIHLTHNYRCTPAIVNTLNQVRNLTLPPMIAAQANTEQDKRPLLIHDTMDTLQTRLVQHVQSSYMTEVVAVLGPVKLAKPKLNGDYKCIGLQWAAAVLRRNSIPITVHYQEGNDSFQDKMPKASNKACIPGTVHLFTLHGSKGLEFDTAVLLNYHANTMGGKIRLKTDLAEKENLWRVAMSRAKSTLYMYTKLNEAPWYSFTALQHHVDVEGPNLRVQCWSALDKEIKRRLHHWLRDVLNNKEVLNERNLAHLERLAELRVEPLEPLFVPTWTVSDLPMWDHLAIVYGMWAENVVYAAVLQQPPPVYCQVKAMIYNRIVIPTHLLQASNKLVKMLNMYESDRLVDIRLLHHAVTVNGGKTMQMLKDLLQTWQDANLGETLVYLTTPNICQYYEEVPLKTWFQELPTEGGLSAAHLWRLCLFRWQHSAEAGHRWHDDYAGVERALDAIMPVVQSAASAVESHRNTKLDIQNKCMWRELAVIGEPDMVFNNLVVELKFSQLDSIMHYLQAWGYAVMLQIDTVEVWNLMTGQRGRVQQPRHDMASKKKAGEALLKPLLDKDADT